MRAFLILINVFAILFNLAIYIQFGYVINILVMPLNILAIAYIINSTRGFRTFSLLLLAGLLVAGLTGCVATGTPAESGAVGTWQATNLGGGNVFQLNTATGHGYMVMPQGTLDVGTPEKPTVNVIPRSTASGLELKIESVPDDTGTLKLGD